VGVGCEVVELMELIRSNVLLVEGDIEFALDFRTGALGIPEKFDEFLVAASIESFGNVVHHGAGGPLNLILESEVAEKVALLGCLINLPGQLSGQLPRFDFFEALDFHEFVLGSLFLVLRSRFVFYFKVAASIRSGGSAPSTFNH